jgi:hypothetical protein
VGLTPTSMALYPAFQRTNQMSFADVAKIITEYPQFFTATILEWKKLLKPDKYKDMIVESICFLVNDKRAIIYGFVIMINHIHLMKEV